MSDQPDLNTRIIEEFRTHHGQVGGGFAGAPLLLLHTVRARYPGFAGHQRKTERVIPVLALIPLEPPDVGAEFADRAERIGRTAT
jgi:hypothetical protein